jgi:hypothetical protein
MDQGHGPRSARLTAFACALLLGACGLGFAPASEGEVDPGSGGGPGAPGEPGVPLGWTPVFTVRNDSDVERTETICASVPLPFGHHHDTAQIGVSGHQTAWRVLQRWRDGSIRVAQAQFTDTIPAATTRTYEIAGGLQPLAGAFERNSWVAQLADTLQIGAEVTDTFDVAYRAFVPSEGETVAETPLVRTVRHRTYHHASSGGIGRDYLTSTFYVTEYRDMPVVVVDWVLGNDYLGKDNPGADPDPNLRPLGGVDVNSAKFLVGGTGVQAIPYRPAENAIEAGQPAGSGRTSYRVMQNGWIDDAQTRRYRFVLAVLHPSGQPADIQHWADTAQAMAVHPCFPLATHGSWYATGSLGLLGGPIAGPADAWQRAEAEYNSFLGGNWFGTWGHRGDPKSTATTGTPRNHPLSPELAHAVQANHHRLLLALEQKAWIQAARPYHLWGLTTGDQDGLFLYDSPPIYPGSRDLSQERLGRKALYANDPYSAYRTRVQGGLQRAHEWYPYDHEHWSTDLLFDYWTVSGDCWAHEELRQLGQSLKAVMRLSTFNTQFVQAVRAEGWTMQSFVQIHLATGDENLKAYALRRVRDNVDPQRHKDHPSRAMQFQGNYTGTGWPLNHEFFMPWQHGAVLYGYLGAYRHWTDPMLLRICEDVVTTVEYSWVTNWQDTTFGFVPNGLRYYVPVSHNGVQIPASHWDAQYGIRFGDSPLGGAHTFLTGGLLLLSDMSGDPTVKVKAAIYGDMLRGGALTTQRWDKWHYVLPEEHAL